MVADDCSEDDTVELCRDWVEKNGGALENCHIVTTDRNTGVSGNLNRGFSVAKGTWIKLMAGDDTLPSDSIEKYMAGLKSMPDAKIAFGKLSIDGPDKNYAASAIKIYEGLYKDIKKSQRHQYRTILKRMFIPSPGIILLKSLWEDIGGFDERYHFCEEDPFFLRVLRKGYRIRVIDDYLYNYRVCITSMGSSDNHRRLSRHYRDRIRFYNDERRGEMLRKGLWFNVLDEDLLYKWLIALKLGRFKQARRIAMWRLLAIPHLVRGLRSVIWK